MDYLVLTAKRNWMTGGNSLWMNGARGATRCTTDAAEQSNLISCHRKRIKKIIGGDYQRIKMKIFYLFNSIWEKSSYWERFMSIQDFLFNFLVEPRSHRGETDQYAVVSNRNTTTKGCVPKPAVTLKQPYSLIVPSFPLRGTWPMWNWLTHTNQRHWFSLFYNPK